MKRLDLRMNLIDFIAKRNNRHFRTDIVITSHNVYYVNFIIDF